MLPDCRWYVSRVVALRVEQHIIQRMPVRFLSQSVDDGGVVGVAVNVVGSGPSVGTADWRPTTALSLLTVRRHDSISAI